MESTFKNMDCIAGMKEYPDKYFDLAIVDPVYGDVTKGGYMNANTKGLYVGTGKAAQKGYHNGLWLQEKTGSEYFKELFRVSNNQIIWGELLHGILTAFTMLGSLGQATPGRNDICRR